MSVGSWGGEPETPRSEGWPGRGPVAHALSALGQVTLSGDSSPAGPVAITSLPAAIPPGLWTSASHPKARDPSNPGPRPPFLHLAPVWGCSRLSPTPQISPKAQVGKASQDSTSTCGHLSRPTPSSLRVTQGPGPEKTPVTPSRCCLGTDRSQHHGGDGLSRHPARAGLTRPHLAVPPAA